MASIVRRIKKDKLLPRIFVLLISSFVLTFIYNKFLVTNHIVIGGVSGLAILIEEVFHISTTLFINIANVILVGLSFIFLGKKKTIEQLIGCVVYIVMLNITSPLAKMVEFNFDSLMLMVIVVSIVYGVCNGLIFRAGYSTGGTDFLAQILSEKLNKSMTQISLIIQVLIISTSVFIFGLEEVMLSIFIIYVSNKITNSVLFGISSNKMVMVVSDKNGEIEDEVMNKLGVGTTILKAKGGYEGDKRQVILCVVHNAQYAKFKNIVLKTDKKAFMMSSISYEVNGGTKYRVLPF